MWDRPIQQSQTMSNQYGAPTTQQEENYVNRGQIYQQQLNQQHLQSHIPLYQHHTEETYNPQNEKNYHSTYTETQSSNLQHGDLHQYAQQEKILPGQERWMTEQQQWSYPNQPAHQPHQTKESANWANEEFRQGNTTPEQIDTPYSWAPQKYEYTPQQRSWTNPWEADKIRIQQLESMIDKSLQHQQKLTLLNQALEVTGIKQKIMEVVNNQEETNKQKNQEEKQPEQNKINQKRTTSQGQTQ